MLRQVRSPPVFTEGATDAETGQTPMSNIPSSFDVSGSAGILGSYLTTVYAPTGDVYSILAGGGTSPQKATVDALATGKMTNGENKVLTAIAEGPSTGTPAPWTNTNTEPTTLANMRAYGWIKLVSKSNTAADGTQGLYELTTLGKAIYARTSGGAITGPAAGSGSTSDAISLAAANSDQASASAAVTSNLSALVSTAASVLSAVGVSVSG
jgi:hypothetical protein